MSRLVSALALFAAAGSFALQAQTATLYADIPFEFRMGQSVMPAGKYAIEQKAGVLKFQNTENHKASIVLVQAAVRPLPGDAAVVFNRYGTEHFLSTVWSPYSGSGQMLPPSRHERELLSRLKGGVETASIPLRGK